MYKNTFGGLALVSAIAVASVTAAVAMPVGAWHHGHAGYGQMRMLGRLNLTDAQRAQINQIMQSGRGQNRAARQALRQQRAGFEAMPPNSVGYQDTATRLAQAEGQATQQRVQRMANLRAQIYAVLTPAQQAQLAAFKAKAQARRQQWQQFKAQHPLSSTP